MSSDPEKQIVGKEVGFDVLLGDGASSKSSVPKAPQRKSNLSRLKKAGEIRNGGMAKADDDFEPTSEISDADEGLGRFRMRDDNDLNEENSPNKRQKASKARQPASNSQKIDQFTKSGPKKPAKGIDDETAKYIEQQQAKRKARKNSDDDWNLQGMKIESQEGSQFAEEFSSGDDSDAQLLRALKASRETAQNSTPQQQAKPESKPSGNQGKKSSRGKKQDEDADDLDDFVVPDDDEILDSKPARVSGSTNRTTRAGRQSNSRGHENSIRKNLDQYDVANMDPEAVEALFTAMDEEDKEIARARESEKKSDEKKPLVIKPSATKKNKRVHTSDEESESFEDYDDESSGKVMKEEKKTSKPKPIASAKSAPKSKAIKTKTTVSDDEEQGTGIEIRGILSGQNIVFTGLFASTGGDDKSQLLEVVKTLGGRCPSSVSKKTTILVAGHILPDGRPTNTSGKYQDAEKKKIKIMTEEEFDEYLREKTGETLIQLIRGGAARFARMGATEALGNKMDEEKPANLGSAPAVKMDQEFQPNKIEPEIPGTTPNQLWTDKYAPRTTDDIIGNQGMVHKLREWLLNWEDVIINGNKREIKGSRKGFNPDAFAQDNLNARAAMLSGSPGIGKTTTVRLLCKELGINLIEQNASDLRNKGSLKGSLGTLTTTNSLSSSAHAGRSVILMDEVDGMTSDRGGTAALNEYIKKTRVPIICICNDRSHPKMRTLAGNCYDLRYNRPSRPVVAQWLMKIIKKEGLDADLNSLETLVEEMNNDIRQILGFLQVWSKRKTNKTFIYATFANQIKRYSKDDAVTVGNFDAAQMLLNRTSRSGKSYKELMGYFFIDYDLVPLLVQENYLSAARRDANDLDTLNRMARAAHSIAKSDKTNLLVRRDQNWKLLDSVGFNSSLYPAHLISEYMPRCQFPEFYGKFSSEKKMRRELTELKEALMGQITGSQDAIKFEYGPTLLNLLKLHMLSGTDQSTDIILEIYEHYGLNPDMVKEHLVDVIFNPAKHDLMESIDSRVKSSLTRQYNNKFKESVVQKKKRRVVAEEEEDFEEGMFEKEAGWSKADGDSNAEPQQDSDDDEIVQAVKAPKGANKKAAAKSKKATK